VTFYENVEVRPPTKSNQGAPNETVTPLPMQTSNSYRARVQLGEAYGKRARLRLLDVQFVGAREQRVT